MRPRRLRVRTGLRDLVAETDLPPERLVLPLFVRPGTGPPEPIASLPGVARYSVDDATEVIRASVDEGLRSVLIFGLPRRKDARGSEAWSRGSAVSRLLRSARRAAPDAILITDVCLCAYTTHGHCGIPRGDTVDNDRTLPLLGQIARSHAEAGADLVAPSAMMDHQVAAIRATLDAGDAGTVGILSYAAKFASAFYGPFREAADSAPSFGDRSTYQLDPRNSAEALREIGADIEEGADIVMVKPALPYLDVIARARERFDRPLAAYQVSGEYAQLKAAAARGWLDERRAVLETLTAIRRAGADLIVTYYARQALGWIRGGP